jgi:hypothetical protein
MYAVYLRNNGVTYSIEATTLIIKKKTFLKYPKIKSN